MPKTITFTLEVEDDFDSFNDLESFVNQEGQKLKKELCEKLVDDVALEDSLSCPKCSHTESIARGRILGLVVGTTGAIGSADVNPIFSVIIFLVGPPLGATIGSTISQKRMV